MPLLEAVVIIAIGTIFDLDISYYLVMSAALIANQLEDLKFELRKKNK